MAYDLNSVRSLDKRIVYVENYPSSLNNSDLAAIFKRAGEVLNVQMPKFSKSD